MLRRLYDWTLSLAARPSAPYALGTVSFSESSFFPVPPDVMLVPMALARPDRAWLYAAVCTATSVAGGMLGYLIGALLYDSVGAWLFKVYGLTEGAEAFRAS
jgi:membrane protein YqaA with SNARE-associated domain